MAEQPREVGRVIFATDSDPHSPWKIQPLSNHVGNVVALVKAWDWRKAYLGGTLGDLDRTRPQLIRAAERHDEGKPLRFRLYYQSNRFRQGKLEWVYSFRGHRFDVYDSDLYVHQLIRLHHEFSVDGITQAVAELRVSGVEYAASFPLDLYTLEMCDQIEATVAQGPMGGRPEARVFMDFCVRSDSPTQFRLDPFPFTEEEVRLPVDFALFQPSRDLLAQAITREGEQRAEAERKMAAQLVTALRSATLMQEEIVLCPLIP